MTPDLKELATAWRDYKLNNVSNTAEHIGMLFVHKRNFERAATPEAILSLIAELEQCRKDAERYRLLVSQPNGGFFHPVFAVNNFLSWKSKAQYDAAIDAAIAKESA